MANLTCNAVHIRKEFLLAYEAFFPLLQYQLSHLLGTCCCLEFVYGLELASLNQELSILVKFIQQLLDFCCDPFVVQQVVLQQIRIIFNEHLEGSLLIFTIHENQPVEVWVRLVV